ADAAGGGARARPRGRVDARLEDRARPAPRLSRTVELRVGEVPPADHRPYLARLGLHGDERPLQVRRLTGALPRRALLPDLIVGRMLEGGLALDVAPAGLHRLDRPALHL